MSPNWFHIARDFTEKWHHQQQIRHAVGKPGILTRDYYKPVLDTFMRALPFRYKDVAAAEGTRIRITVESTAGGSWSVVRDENDWTLVDNSARADASASIPAEIAWQLFTKALRFDDVKDQVKIEGDRSLCLPALRMITVMA